MRISGKAVDKAIELSKEFSQAESLYLCSNKTRIQLLQEETAGMLCSYAFIDASLQAGQERLCSLSD